MNLKMPELKRCFESAEFTEVKTLLSSGNVVFKAKGTASAVERRARRNGRRLWRDHPRLDERARDRFSV